jgi:hypothetical protein
MRKRTHAPAVTKLNYLYMYVMCVYVWRFVTHHCDTLVGVLQSGLTTRMLDGLIHS